MGRCPATSGKVGQTAPASNGEFPVSRVGLLACAMAAASRCRRPKWPCPALRPPHPWDRGVTGLDGVFSWAWRGEIYGGPCGVDTVVPTLGSIYPVPRPQATAAQRGIAARTACGPYAKIPPVSPFFCQSQAWEPFFRDRNGVWRANWGLRLTTRGRVRRPFRRRRRPAQGPPSPRSPARPRPDLENMCESNKIVAHKDFFWYMYRISL